MTTKKHDVVCVPFGLDVKQVLAPHLLDRKDSYDNMSARVYYILDTLYKMQSSREWREYFEEFGGYPVQSRILNNILGKKYKEALDLLENAGVIERTKGYRVGHYSKLVRFTPKYSSVLHEYRSLPADCSVTQKIKDFREQEERDNQLELNRIPYITKWFDPLRLCIDKTKAHAFIEFYRSHMQSLLTDNVDSQRSAVELEARINFRTDGMLRTMNALLSGHMGLKKTGKDHRLHSIISRTKKELRRLYTYDGKPLVSIDLKASQPYLLTTIMKPESWKVNGLIHKVFPELFSMLQHQPPRTPETDSLLMFGVFANTGIKKDAINTGFSALDWQEDFYQMLVDRAEASGKPEIFPSRTEAKKKMMMILFDDNPYMDRDESFLQFSEWFPLEAHLISRIKELSRDEKKAKVENPMSYLPLLLQRVESFLILEKVCLEASKKYPDAPLIPVHDCIMTTEEYQDQIAGLVREILKNETGLLPGITIEKSGGDYSKDDVFRIAADDFAEILQTKPRSYSESSILPPLLSEPPSLEGDWIISSRYFEGGLVEGQNEVVFHLIDDTKNSVNASSQ